MLEVRWLSPSGVLEGEVSGIEFQHSSFDPADERYSLVQVRGAKVKFENCQFVSGSGHGLAISEGGEVSVSVSEFRDNGWNGISVRGKGSVLNAEGNTIRGNFQNGIEAWEGPRVSLTGNSCMGNFYNGLHIDAGENEMEISGNKLTKNNEYGLVLSGGKGGAVKGNMIAENLLGGVVARSSAVGVKVSDNDIRQNEGPGLALEAGVVFEDYVGNRISQNGGKQLITDLSFGEE